eukprot:217827_1
MHAQQHGNHSHNPTSHLSHDQPRNKPSTNSNNHSDYAQYRKQIPCKFWMHAGCNRGDTCYYKHNILEESVLAHVADHIITSVEAKMTRIMHIALDAQTKSITNITQNQIDHMESRIIQTLRKDLVKTMENQQTKRNKTYQNNLTKLVKTKLKSIRSSIDNNHQELAQSLLSHSIALQRMNQIAQDGLEDTRAATMHIKSTSVPPAVKLSSAMTKQQTECFQTTKQVRHHGTILSPTTTPQHRVLYDGADPHITQSPMHTKSTSAPQINHEVDAQHNGSNITEQTLHAPEIQMDYNVSITTSIETTEPLLTARTPDTFRFDLPMIEPNNVESMHDSEKYGGGDLTPVKFDWTDTSYGSIHGSNIDGASCAMNNMEYKPPAVKPSISNDMDASQQEAAQTMTSGMDLNKEATELNLILEEEEENDACACIDVKSMWSMHTYDTDIDDKHVDDGSVSPITSNTSIQEQQLKAQQLKECGNELYRKRQYNAALEVYRDAQKLDPSDPIYISNESAVLYMMGRNEECIECCERAINMDPDRDMSFKLFRRIGTRLSNLH